MGVGVGEGEGPGLRLGLVVWVEIQINAVNYINCMLLSLLSPLLVYFILFFKDNGHLGRGCTDFMLIYDFYI